RGAELREDSVNVAPEVDAVDREDAIERRAVQIESFDVAGPNFDLAAQGRRVVQATSEVCHQLRDVDADAVPGCGPTRSLAQGVPGARADLGHAVTCAEVEGVQHLGVQVSVFARPDEPEESPEPPTRRRRLPVDRARDAHAERRLLSPPANPGPSFAGFTGDQVTTSVGVVALVRRRRAA